MLSIRNQLICLSIAMLLMTCFQSDQVNGQIKKKKLLKGLMGASLLKLFKSKKGVYPLPIPLPLPLPIEWVLKFTSVFDLFKKLTKTTS